MVSGASMSTPAAAKRVPGTQQIGLPNGIAFAADGTMYVTDSIAGAVWRVPPDGTATQWVQAALLEGDESIGFGIPIGANGIALDEASGTVYVAVMEQGALVAIPIEDDGSAGEPAVHTTFTDAQSPVLVDGIALDAANNLYVAQPAANTVVRVTPAGDIETVATQADGLDGPASVAVAHRCGRHRAPVRLELFGRAGPAGPAGWCGSGHPHAPVAGLSEPTPTIATLNRIACRRAGMSVQCASLGARSPWSGRGG